jgi:hypothetical protein
MQHTLRPTTRCYSRASKLKSPLALGLGIFVVTGCRRRFFAVFRSANAAESGGENVWLYVLVPVRAHAKIAAPTIQKVVPFFNS